MTVYGSQETSYLLKRYRAGVFQFQSTAPQNLIKLNTASLFFHQLKRLYYGLRFIVINFSAFKNFDFVYTASDFPSDVIFGLAAKIANPKIRWLAGFYLFAPNPLNLKSPYFQSRQFFRGLIYYLGQKPVYWLITRNSDTVLLTSMPDVSKFTGKSTLVIQGGINLPTASEFNSVWRLSPQKRKYQALFIGRLHSQKGVLLLVDIWRLVVNRLPTAQLAIVGDGELLPSLKTRIGQLGLTKNIRLLGFQTGIALLKTINNAQIILHPATYDSGGMAAAQAMAWGLPGVSFDLPSLKSYYSRGMLKTPCFDISLFSQNILSLLTDSDSYRFQSQLAREFTQTTWGWNTRLKDFYSLLLNSKRF